MEKLEKIIDEDLERLQALNIIEKEQKEELKINILKMPEEILANMTRDGIRGTILSNVGVGEYDFESMLVMPRSNKVYAWDMEAIDIGTMYTNLLRGINAIANGEFSIIDIVEDTSEIDEEMGAHKIKFKCGGKEYEYEAENYYDWFDIKILPFISSMVKEQATGKEIYAMSDSWGGCILFYEKRQWVSKFEEIMGITLEKFEKM